MSGSRRMLLNVVPRPEQWETPITFDERVSVWDIIYDAVNFRYVMVYSMVPSPGDDPEEREYFIGYISALNPDIGDWTSASLPIVSHPTSLFHDTVKSLYRIGNQHGIILQSDYSLNVSEWHEVDFGVEKILHNVGSDNHILILNPPAVVTSNGPSFLVGDNAVPVGTLDAVQVGDKLVGVTLDGRIIRGSADNPLNTWADVITGLAPMSACAKIDTDNKACCVGDNGTVVFLDENQSEQHNYTNKRLGAVCWDEVSGGKIYFGGEDGTLFSLQTNGDGSFPTETPVIENTQTTYDIIKLKKLNSDIVGLTYKENEIIIRS